MPANTTVTADKPEEKPPVTKEEAKVKDDAEKVRLEKEVADLKAQVKDADIEKGKLTYELGEKSKIVTEHEEVVTSYKEEIDQLMGRGQKGPEPKKHKDRKGQLLNALREFYTEAEIDKLKGASDPKLETMLSNCYNNKAVNAGKEVGVSGLA